MTDLITDIPKDSFHELLIEITKYIYKEIGVGHSEKVYHECFGCELGKRFNIEQEKVVPVIFKDTEDIIRTVGFMRLDIFVHDIANGKKYLLELKQIKALNTGEENQVQRYVSMLGTYHDCKIDEAYLVNFPDPKKCQAILDAEVRRVV